MNVPARVVDTQTLTAAVKGTVVRPGDSTYDAVRAIWNAMIDRRPAVIVRCADAADVAAAIGFAREQGLEISIRGGGHNIAGSSVCEGGVMIDLSQMRQVRVDAAARRAYVEPGALLADVDRATLEHGLATPLGINSTTGVAGLTLGGGFGWLTRTHGMTVDNLVSAEVVGADGTMRRASAAENPDLFWALRGGGGNFGVVTRFEFALHPIPPEVMAGLLVFPMAHASEILARYRAFVERAPESLNVWAVLRKAPPLPFLPAEVHGQGVVVLAVFSAGDPGEAAAQIDQLRRFGPLLGEHVGPAPYGGWQQAFDPLLAPGARNYWKSHNFTELSDGAIAALATYAGQLPSDQCEIFVALVSGAANRVRGGRHGVCRTRHAPGGQRARALGGRPRRCRLHRVGPGVLRGVAAVRVGRGLRQLHDRGRGRPRPVGLRRQLRAARRAEAPVRSGQRVPREPEHRAVNPRGCPSVIR